MQRSVLSVSALLVWLAACGGASEEATPPDVVPTGRDCAKAEVRCGGGRCVAAIDNRCDLPITCSVQVESICQVGGESGRTNASSKEVTTLGHAARSIEAQVSCEGAVVTTTLERLACE